MVTTCLLQFTVVVVVATGSLVWMYGQWAVKMYSGRSVVKHGIYQLSLSKGLTESHRSAMHQYTTLLSHLTVTALRPVRRGEERRLSYTKANIPSAVQHRRCR